VKEKCFDDGIMYDCVNRTSDCINSKCIFGSEETTTTNEAQNCAKSGEQPGVFDLRTGKSIPDGKSCCVGLKQIDQSPLPADKELCALSASNPGICAPCGNGECEPQYGEHRCNCGEDCRNNIDVPLNCGKCVQYSPPAPGWCDDGIIISPQMDECGCYGHPVCERN
jgi:hypothetical protein